MTGCQGLAVATLNIHGGLEAKLPALRRWQVEERLDVVCLTEVGLIRPHALGSNLFYSQDVDSPARGGSAVLVAPWLSGAKSIAVARNGLYVAVAVPVGDVLVSVVAAYAPCTPHLRAVVASAFWRRLTVEVASLPQPVVLGMDANYAPLPHDRSDPDTWVDVESKIEDIGTFWTTVGIADCHQALHPGVVAHTFFSALGEGIDFDNHWHCEESYEVPCMQLAPHCVWTARLDIIGVSPALLSGASVWVMPTSPVRTDHRPVVAHLPALNLWSVSNHSPQPYLSTLIDVECITDAQKYAYYQEASAALSGILTDDDTCTLSLDTLNERLVSALLKAGADCLPVKHSGGDAPGIDATTKHVDKILRRIRRLLWVAHNPIKYLERHGSNWMVFGKARGKGLTTLCNLLKTTAAKTEDDVTGLDFQPSISALTALGSAGIPSDDTWNELIDRLEVLRDSLRSFLRAKRAALSTAWVQLVETTPDVAFARNPKFFIRSRIRAQLGGGRPQWLHQADGTKTTDPQLVKDGYNAFFASLYRARDVSAGSQDAGASVSPGLTVPQPARSPRTKVAPHWAEVMRPIDAEELLASVRHMRPRTAPGPDALIVPLVKLAATPVEFDSDKGKYRFAPTILEITPMMRILDRLWNRCLVQSAMPTHWKRSHITLLPKNEDGLAGMPSKMRPISISSILHRGFTWILAKRLAADGDHMIEWGQRGFRPNASCLDVVEIIDTLMWQTKAAWQIRDNYEVGLVQVDIAKAYDSIDHQAMLDDLREAGFPPAFTDLIANSLHGLQARIWTYYGLSPAFGISRGIRQGDPLSPILFSILVGRRMAQAARRARRDPAFTPLCYYHSEREVPAHLEYADDCTLLTRNPQSATCLLRYCEDELSALGLHISPEKSVCMGWGWDHEDVYLNGHWLATAGFDACRILGYWVDVAHWNTQNAKLTTSLLSILARVSASGLSACNKIRVWNWIAGGMISYWAPIADIASTVATLDKRAEAAAKSWLGLHFSVSSASLHTPINLGGCGLISLADTTSARRAAHLIRRHRQFLVGLRCSTPLTDAYYQAYSTLLDRGFYRWELHPTPTPLKREVDKRGLWLLRGISDWHRLDVHLHHEDRTKSQQCSSAARPWLEDLPVIPGPCDGVLDVWTDGSASDGKAGAGIIAPGLPGGDFTFRHRVWGAQTSYRAELTAIYLACRMAPEGSDLVIHTDSMAAIQAINNRKTIQRRRRPEVTTLLTQVVDLVLARSGNTSFVWVKAHVGHALNEQVDQLAKAALNLDPVHPPTGEETWFSIGGSLASSDFNKLLGRQAERRFLSAFAGTKGKDGGPLRSSEWLAFIAKGWHAVRLPPGDAAFTVKTRGHSMATSRRAALYFPGQGRCLDCGLCGALTPPIRSKDDAVHWMYCPALMPLWGREIAAEIASKRLPDSEDFHQLCLDQREALVWGLVPGCVSADSRGKAGRTFVALARRVWRERDLMWKALYKDHKATEPPVDWILSRHHLHAAGLATRAGGDLDEASEANRALLRVQRWF